MENPKIGKHTHDRGHAAPAMLKKVHMTNLDGLRGLGILEVLLYHMGYSIMRHAWLCISIFFALSGLLITGITIQAFERTGEVEVVRFWSRRIGRLFPSLFLVICMCAISRFFREEDEAQLWWEKNDLIWATTWLENYNLVFIRQDDYWASQKPSMARHLWTLAIEEQYYLVWPLIYWAACKCFPPAKRRTAQDTDERTVMLLQESNRDFARDCEAAVNSTVLEETNASMRVLMLALCVGECGVIAMSYFSSWVTIEELGMSAAYYSTWSRMGDFACGGLMFLLVRLHPQVYKRYTQQEGLAPMTTAYRVMLEFGWFLCLCLTVLPPMVQMPLADALVFYFYYFRLPFSFGICVFAVAGVLQISEPLPKWAVFSRFTSSKFMVMLGVVSYGVYLNHWPMILFFGDHVDPSESARDSNMRSTGMLPDLYTGQFSVQKLVRDVCLAAISLAFGFVSFMLYEKPLMSRAARAKQPWKVIACGGAGAAVTVAVVCACYAGVRDPRATYTNDLRIGAMTGVRHGAVNGVQEHDWAMSEAVAPLQWEEQLGFSVIPGLERPNETMAAHADNRTALPPPSQALEPDPIFEKDDQLFPEAKPEPNLEPQAVIDARRTPLWLFAGYHRRSDVSLLDLLDLHSRPTRRVRCQDNKHDCAANCEHEQQKLMNQLSRVNVNDTVTIMCKSYSAISPCDSDWQAGNSWVWLSSLPICGAVEESVNSTAGWQRRCPDKIRIVELDLPNTSMPTHSIVPGEMTYTGRMGLDTIYLYSMLFAVDELLGGNAINKETLQHLKAGRQDQEELEWQYQQSSLVGSNLTWTDEVKLLILGESIAQRIGGMFKEQLDNSMHCVSQKLAEHPFPRITVINGAHRGKQATNFFLPCTQNIPEKHFQDRGPCNPRGAETRRTVLMSIPSAKPDVVVLHDQHWTDGKGFESEELRIAALSNLLKQAITAGVGEFFYTTYSCVDNAGIRGANQEHWKLQKFLSEKRCQSGDANGISFTVVAWHKLTCPTFYEQVCHHQAHGFHDILPDGHHPSGPAGEWLTAQALATITASIARHRFSEFGYAEWQDAIQNPVSACMLEQQAPDNFPPLHQLTERFFVCP